LSSKETVEANQWGTGAETLEWTVDSPAPFHTHEDTPTIQPEQQH
jgi:cytochrome c oxidase subunit 1